MSLLFISDLHLTPRKPAIIEAFYDFLHTIAQDAKSLYILGDFFEVWLGDDDDTPVYQEIIQCLQNYRHQGHDIYFMHGNRDFLISNSFIQRIEGTLLPDPTIITYKQTSYLLMHGDTLCTKDHEYMIFRKISHNKQWQQQILAKPLTQRRQFAAKIQQYNRKMKNPKRYDSTDVVNDEVLKMLSIYQVNRLIHGHTHRPNKHALVMNQEPAERWVLGDWAQYGWYIRIDSDTPSLPSLESFVI